MVTYVIGDIHGRFKALKQVLEYAHFDFERDRLIQLGDVCDGGTQTRQCIDLLLKIKNRVDICGNHDYWLLEWFDKCDEKHLWVQQGGYATMESYGFDLKTVPETHKEFIRNAVPYYIDEMNRVYVHGGFNPKVPIKNQKTENIMWDRTLYKFAINHRIPGFRHVFIGHTSTQHVEKNRTTPITFNNLTMCDCGAGWMGRLAMINVDNLSEIFISDKQVPNVDEMESEDGLFIVKS